ncbi:MAG: thioredoxin family protein [Phycisphaerae bacterium]|jgi:thiol:disulfide interchange protein DsbD
MLPGFLMLGLLATMQPAPPAPPPRLDVKLYAASESVSPGGQMELLVEIQVAKPWHIYHPIILDTGLPTTIEFAAPPDVSFGEIEFPAPKLGELQGIEYLELSGRVLVLTRLNLAPSAPRDAPLKLSATVSALACIEQCVPVKAIAELVLPVRAAPGAPANTQLFDEARVALAPPLAGAPHLDGGELRLSADRIALGQDAELVATIRVKPGLHILDRDAGSELLIPSRLYIESRNGIKFAGESEQLWPAPKVRSIEGFGSIREQSGELKIRVPMRIEDAKFPSGPVALRVLFQYQACTDQGQCFPPQLASGWIRFYADTPTPPAEPAAARAPTARGDGENETRRPGSAPSAAAVDGRPEDSSRGDSGAPITLWAAVGLAFLGGMILNIMPCVLPVISLKVISFVQQGGEDRYRVLALGLMFCLGILVWFWLFALLSMTGRLPLQYPAVVVAVGGVLCVFALNLFGVFEIMLPGTACCQLDAIASREGYGGAFFKGFLATLLGTACTAPFLGSALVYAASQPPLVSFNVFTAAGVGMALPYFLLAANPRWLRFVPRPGPWMVTFKQGAGFILLGTAVWLLTILAKQLGAGGVVWTVSFWGFLGLAAWMIGLIRHTWSPGARYAMWTAAACVAALGGWFSFGVMYRPEERAWASVDPESVIRHVASRGWNKEIPWAPYAPRLAEELSRRGYTVYVDYTAAWCVNCQVNKTLVLETAAIREKMRSLGVIPIEADFTNEDPLMLAEITRRGRNSVPLNIILPAGRPDAEIILPVLLTQSIVAEALDQAGPSREAPGLARRAP